MKKKTTKVAPKTKSTIKARTVSTRAHAKRKPVASKTKKATQPKGIKHHAKRLYHLTPKFIHGMVVGAFVGIVVLVPLGKIGSTSALAIDSGKDCDRYSIINCGVTSTSNLIAHYKASNYVRLAYTHMGISSADVLGMNTTAVAGTVYDDGTVKVGGTLVAKNVKTEARERVTSGDQVASAGDATFYVRSLASSWSHKSAPAYVVMKNHVFQFAILAPCGNPIVGTPTTSPPPVPNILVCDLYTKKMVTIKESAYNTTHYSKNAADCNIATIKVCDLTTLKVISIKENTFNSRTQTKNLAACTPPPGDIVVCDLATNTMITIKENAFNATAQSKNPADCEPTPVVLEATSLPNTGPGAVLIVFGLSILGGYVFHMRHRHVQHRKRSAHHTR